VANRHAMSDLGIEGDSEHWRMGLGLGIESNRFEKAGQFHFSQTLIVKMINFFR
jgi:hypothetical protein